MIYRYFEDAICDPMQDMKTVKNMKQLENIFKPEDHWSCKRSPDIWA